MNNHPKRRKDKDNPYELFNINNEYYIIFVDNKKIIQRIEISREVYEEFNIFELDDIRQLHKYERHIEHYEVYETTLNKRAILKEIAVEDKVEEKIMNERLYDVINSLPYIYKKRLIMYYFKDLNVKEIAKIEKTTHQAISKSIRKGICEIKKMMKN